MGTFVQDVLNAGASYTHIDIVFDQQYEFSIKSATRTRYSQGTRPIRRVIEHVHVPYPSNWNNFISLSENKKYLVCLIMQAPNSKVIVAAGGFANEEMDKSSSADVDKEPLEARHEEASPELFSTMFQITQR